MAGEKAKTEKKVVEPKQKSVAKPAEKVEAQSGKGKRPHAKGYLAASMRIRNPYSGDIFMTSGEPKRIVELDGWIECQVAAGVLIEAK